MKTKIPHIPFHDYSPFGVTLSGRSWSGEGYRYRQRIKLTIVSGSALRPDLVAGSDNTNSQSTNNITTSTNSASNSSTNQNGGPQPNFNPTNQVTATPPNTNILPFVAGGRGLNRNALLANGYVPLITTQGTGRINFLMQPNSNDGTAVNPSVIVAVLRSNGLIQVLGTLNATSAIGYNLRASDQLLYMSTGGKNTTVTYTETR